MEYARLDTATLAQYLESRFIRSEDHDSAALTLNFVGADEINSQSGNGYKDDKNASRSGLGFQGVTRVGVRPARRQNISRASRFIWRLVVMYRLVVATDA